MAHGEDLPGAYRKGSRVKTRQRSWIKVIAIYLIVALTMLGIGRFV